MNKNKNNATEKHYTPNELQNELLKLVKRFVPYEPTEFLETSAGGGALIDAIKKKYPKANIIAYDIQNERNRADITETNYLKEKIEYKKGRVCVQNPPFTKGLKFVYKALEESDWCFTILSQNSILNLDYTKYWVEEIQLWRNYQFPECKVSVSLMAIRKRNETDRYEYEDKILESNP